MANLDEWSKLAPLAFAVMTLLPIDPHAAREYDLLADLNNDGFETGPDDLRHALESLIGMGLVIRLGEEWARVE